MNLKTKATKLFDRWCEMVNRDIEKIGASILEHNKEMLLSLGSDTTKGTAEQDYGAFDNSDINFVWLYEAYFISTSFNTKADFITKYLELQKERFDNIHRGPDDTLQNVLERMLGFFVVEHQVQQTTEYIVSMHSLQSMWKEAATKLRDFSASYLSLKQGLDVFLKTKDQMTFFIKAVKVYDYDASPLVGALQSIFSKYATKIEEQYYNKLKSEIKPELFQVCTPTSDQEKEYMTIIQKESNPNLKEVSLPNIYSHAFFKCLEQIYPFIQELERYEVELDMSLEPICAAIQEFMCELLKVYPKFLKTSEKATLDISYQMLTDLEGLEKTTPLICHLIGQCFSHRFTDSTKISKYLMLKRSIETVYKSVKEWICVKYSDSIQEIIKGCDVMPQANTHKQHDFMDIIITFTKNQFAQLASLSPIIVSEVQTQILQQLNECMTNLVLNANKFNSAFMEQYQMDITAIESYCLANPTFKSQVYTFVWCKQIALFFNDPHPEEILVEETRNKKFSRLTDKSQLVTLIGKFDTNSIPRNDPRKKAFNTVKSQLPKLKN